MSASLPVFGRLRSLKTQTRPSKEADTWNLLRLSSNCYKSLFRFSPLRHLRTFVQIANGWILSHRRRFVTDVIFSGGNIDNGHWSRFHRFFSHAAWDLDVLSMHLAKLVWTILAPGSTLLWAVDDTLCRKRGLTVYGTGMHHDPLISSRAKPLVSWGHDWVVLCLLVVHPFWAPSKVFALPIAMRLYRNRQGLTKGKKGKPRRPNANPTPIIAHAHNWPANSSA